MYLYCDYDTSVMLKEIGFNETCEYCFDTNKSSAIERQTPTNVFGMGKHNSSDPYLVARPFLIDAVNWISVHHNIEINSYRIPGLALYAFKCYGLPTVTDGVVYHNEHSCYNKAIQYALKFLLHDRK